MAIKKEFARRLERLNCAIYDALEEQTTKKDLMPALLSVLSYILSKKVDIF